VNAATQQQTAYYVYGVVPTGRPLPALGDQGVDPAFPPEVLAHGSLAAVVARIGLAADADSDEPDPETAVARVLAHERVLDRIVDAGVPVVPFRFGAACAGPDDVMVLLDGRRNEFEEALARLEGRIELGVKAYVDDARVAEAVTRQDERLSALEAEVADASPGAAHLKRKQLERLAGEAAMNERLQRAASLHERLASASVDASTNPLPEPTDGLRPILNGAYLVARDDEETFRRAAADAAAEHADVAVRIDVTGPWPAYNFVESEA
jgi:hypothetical protein